MAEPQFIPGPHPSHDWHHIEGRDDDPALVCHSCQICTCHSPVASTESCEYADQKPADPSPARAETAPDQAGSTGIQDQGEQEQDRG